jgi:transaldolase
VNILIRNGYGTDDIYQTITIEDIRQTADLLQPIYNRTNGRDGFVSLEISPHLAYETDRTIAEAWRLWKLVNRPNLMIKVPATGPGLPVIQRLITEGLNVNVTLIFSLARYREVAEAYLAGIKTRAEAGLPIERVASVASFFVSRINGLETINTIPLETLVAYRTHGQPAPRLGTGLEEAHQTLKNLYELGIDINEVTAQLETEGIRKFIQPHDELMAYLRQQQEQYQMDETAEIN